MQMKLTQVATVAVELRVVTGFSGGEKASPFEAHFAEVTAQRIAWKPEKKADLMTIKLAFNLLKHQVLPPIN